MKKVVKNQLAYWFPVYIWAALIFYFSSSPLTPPPVSRAGIDLVIVSDYYKHAIVYGFLTFLLWRASHNSKFRYAKVFAIITATLYGMSTELHQYFVPGRSSSLFDAFSNFIGCILVQPLIMLYKKFPRNKKK